MCGIAGVVRPHTESPVEESSLLRMARALRHRGPDGYGLVLDRGAGFASTRLAIVDLPHGWQPLEAGLGGGLLVYNGEVYNHPELRADLAARGETFETHSDTEVVLRLLERDGLAALDRLNGQFALAWWHADTRRLVLVRDRFGVRPLHYALRGDGTLVFGSEAKALFASGEIGAAPDLEGLDDVFTLWGPRPPRTPFRGVRQLPPGGLLVWEAGAITAERTWWSADLGGAGSPGDDLEDTLRDSVALRLRADVPVGAYLSGGLDSSVITALAGEEAPSRLRTFSVAFGDPLYDERSHQEKVALALGTTHHTVEIGPTDIAAGFAEVVRHAETPLVRTAPVPLFLLAQEVARQGLKVVITGEGADELFWGYDLFKEVAIRQLHDHDPQQALALLDGLYPYLGAGGARRGPAWRRFLLETGDHDDLLRSHLTRVEATAAVKAFYRADVAAELGRDDAVGRLRGELPEAFGDWGALERAAWLEMTTLMSPYLLAAQGDRVAMAHGVEGRYPFLDHRVFELAAALAPEQKLDGMRDKVALREVAAKLLPASAATRPKQPYRAPEVAPFFGPDAPDWSRDLLSPTGLAEAGIWDERRVATLVRRAEAGRVAGVRESMAIVGILSTGLWHRAFIASDAGRYPAETAEPHVRIDRTERATTEQMA